MCSSATEKKREGERKGEGEWEMAANKGEVFCLHLQGTFEPGCASPHAHPCLPSSWVTGHLLTSPEGANERRGKERDTHTHTQFSHHSNTNYNFFFFFLCFFLFFLNLGSYMYGCIYTITTTVILIKVVVTIYLFRFCTNILFYLFLC